MPMIPHVPSNPHGIAYASEQNALIDQVNALSGRVEEYGELTANVAAGGFQSYTVTFSKAFPSAPHVTVTSGSGRASLGITVPTTSSVDIGVDNFTSGDTGDFSVYWRAVEKA